MRQDAIIRMATETLEGYVIDLGCVRKNPREDLLQRARTHTRDCALMGHCIESGYGIVSEDDELTVLDSAATHDVIDVVEDSDKERGIVLRVQRETTDDEIQTRSVEEIGGG